MKTVAARMLIVGLATAWLAGCQEKTEEPVEQAPQAEAAPLPRFPESFVPEVEAQPQASAASPLAKKVGAPVDTTATAAQKDPASTPLPKPKEHYARPVKEATRTHVVRKGDTLQTISKKFYGTTKKWRRIHKANRKTLTKGPDSLQVGMKLVIP